MGSGVLLEPQHVNNKCFSGHKKAPNASQGVFFYWLIYIYKKQKVH